MRSKKEPYHLHIGMRNIKTALSATLCAFLYWIIDRNPTFACIGAIFGTGSSMEHSCLSGGNRFFGTLIGGVLGMGLFRCYLFFYPDGSIHLPMLAFVFLGVVLLILASQIFHWEGGIQPGGVILCILLFNTPVESYISYSLDRILDTGIGVLVALLVNLLLPRELVHGWLEKFHLRKKTQADKTDGQEEQPERSEETN